MRRLLGVAVLAAGLMTAPATPAELWDNGPLVTTPGGGFGGADVSERQTLLGERVIGYAHYPWSPPVPPYIRIEDDFTIADPAGWQIDTIKFFAYQTGSSTQSTITAVNLRIWDGHPRHAESSVVFGDTTTNRMISTTWSGIYRADDVAPLNTERPIMENVVEVNAVLGPGTYWLDWQCDGTLDSGPWAPPVSLAGGTHPPGANAWQWINTYDWEQLWDSGSNTPDDLPFVIHGTVEAEEAEVVTLFWSEVHWPSNTGDIRRVETDGSGLETILSVQDGLRGIAVDPSAGKIYWTDVDRDKIQRANLDGSDVEDLITSGLVFPMDIALDLAAGKLYWADLTTALIGRANLDGTDVEILISNTGEGVISVALDTVNDLIYWSEVIDVSRGKIRRANLLDGSDAQDVVAEEGRPADIDLDIAGGTLYWTDFMLDKVRRLELDGGEVEDLYAAGENLNPVGLILDLDAGKLYWGQEIPGLSVGKIMRMKLDGSDPEDFITDLVGLPVRFALLAGVPGTIYGIHGWGDNTYGATDVPGGDDFKAITAGHYHGLALKDDGSLVAWGQNTYGQIDVPGGNDFVAVAGGANHSLALRDDGSIVGWGSNVYGQINVPAGNDSVAIASFANHSLALRDDGSIVAWGLDNYGQVSAVPAGTDFVFIGAGGAHSLAVKADGSLVAWGDNEYGQTDVPGGNDFVAIDGGYWHSVALKTDGSLVAWGYDAFGQVSNVPAGNDFVGMAAGGYHGLAIKQDGSLVGWGSNDDGEINVPAGNDFVAVAGGGYYFSLALARERIPGDLNHDGRVDLSDLATLLANYGATSGMSYEDGDIDADGDVDLADLAELLAHYGEGCP